MQFEWDDAKAASNLGKHGVDFEDALSVFLDPRRLAAEDGRRDYGEPRLRVLGVVGHRVLLVVCTWRGGVCRFRRGRPMRAKHGATTRTLDPANPPRGRTDWQRVDALSDEEIERAARADPDARPLSDHELEKFQRVVDVKALRRRLKMSQERFARSFHLSVGTVRDWEQGRSLPDRPARVLLQLIESNPEIVLETLQASITSPALEES